METQFPRYFSIWENALDPAHHQKIKELFHQARELSETQQRGFLQDLPTGLAAEVGLMLQAYQGSQGDPFFGVLDECSSAPENDRLAGWSVPPLLRDTTEAGSRFGPYQLVSILGEGGMGVVYQANRVDDSFQSQVAIKILKRGMDTDQITARFKNERQILADLSHRHIAKILDGGSTPDGRPYLVMEFVVGQTLHQYCDSQRLTVEKRIALFIKICRAVAFAHRHLVVHRDLKPGNILVTADGEPKLLDFGIAKILRTDTDLRRSLTEIGSLPLTPAYASPEQVNGDAITTASDIYSLGVLLYELLSGNSPYRLNNANLLHLRQAINENDPSKPSVQLAKGARENQVDGCGTPAANRSLAPVQLVRRLARRSGQHRLKSHGQRTRVALRIGEPPGR